HVHLRSVAELKLAQLGGETGCEFAERDAGDHAKEHPERQITLKEREALYECACCFSHLKKCGRLSSVNRHQLCHSSTIFGSKLNAPLAPSLSPLGGERVSAGRERGSIKVCPVNSSTALAAA